MTTATKGTKKVKLSVQREGRCKCTMKAWFTKTDEDKDKVLKEESLLYPSVQTIACWIS